MIQAAYLRVYLPKDRAGDWVPYAGGSPRPGLVRADSRFMWQESTSDDAFSVEWRDQRFVCPRYPRLRMLEGALAFFRASPSPVLLPEPTVQSIMDELQHIRSRTPSARSYILTSPWHVPLRWFSVFDPDDRELYEASFGTSMRYRTYLGAGKDRVDRAVGILDSVGFDESVVDPAKDLANWLEEFPRDAMVELDYGRVAQLFAEGDLVLDESAADVRSSLDALAEEDFDQAGLHYANVATRWAPAQALAYVN